MQALRLQNHSSLVKVFPNQAPEAVEYRNASALRGEVFSYQIAYHWTDRPLQRVEVTVESPLSASVTVRKEDLVPCDLPCYPETDDNYLNKQPGLYPDPLGELPSAGLTLYPNQHRALWVSVDVPLDAPTGDIPITVRFATSDGAPLGETSFTLTVLAAELPPQKLIYTNWLHADCLSTWYKVDVFSPEHWTLIRTYLRAAVKHGMNMLLTPLLTPCLDTAVGGERPTVQLVAITAKGGQYAFDFTLLDRWLTMGMEEGIEYFEFAPLFTQWGAEHAPKVIAMIDGTERRIFGWETDATDAAYRSFLQQLLHALSAFLDERNLINRCYFHVSDEPYSAHIETYRTAKAIIREALPDARVIDALSDVTFFRTGDVECPIPSNNHIDAFVEAGVPELWTYYCCSQHFEVPNRFIDMPSARNRILGFLLYAYDVRGFLQWAFNFYYSQYSIYPINPYQTTSADGWVPSGDPFVVYPGENGPVISLRLMVFREALQDLRALQALEAKIGRAATLEWLQSGLSAPLSMTAYPRDKQWLLQKRQALNAQL